MNLLRITALCLIITSCKAQKLKTNKDDNTLLWEVSGKGMKGQSYLFGTFHLLCKKDIHFSKQLQDAVKRSDEVYLELDMDDPKTLFGGMALMNMKNGKQLSDFYKPEEYKRILSSFQDTLQISLAMFTGMKPSLIETLLYPKLMPCKTITGVDEEVIRLAKEDKKKINGLETIEFQASVFDSIPYEEQAKELLKTIDSIDAYKQNFDSLMDVYKSQQISEIEKSFNKSEFGMEDNQDLLLNNRNSNWVKQLKQIMKEKRVFVAVGAGHLVGPKGLIALLRKEGYTVRPLENLKQE